MSVIWVFSANLETIKSYWYGRTVIHNCQAMTYEQAHNILNDKAPDNPSLPPPPPLTAGSPVDPSLIGPLKEDLSILQRLARKLRKDRETVGGAVDLSSGDLGTELKFSLDENGNPTKVMPKKELEIHHTIAEMMILANQSVAEKIYNTFPESSLLRIHRKVNDDQFDELESALKAGGIAFDGSSNMALAESLEKAKRTAKGNNIVNALWQSLATRYEWVDDLLCDCPCVCSLSCILRCGTEPCRKRFIFLRGSKRKGLAFHIMVLVLISIPTLLRQLEDTQM